MKSTSRILIICLMLLGGLSLRAQTDSLGNYLAIAAKNNPTVLQRYAEYQAALEKVPQVGALPDPQLSLGVFLSPMEIISGKQYANIQLMQMFPWFGTLKASKDEMSMMAKAKYAAMEDAKAQVFYEIQRSWFELYKINHNILIAEKNLDILRTTERLALAKFKSPIKGSYSSSIQAPSASLANTAPSGSGMNGMGGNANATSTNNSSSASMNSMPNSSGSSGLADLYRVQMEISDLESNISILRNNKQTAIAQFNSYLNRAPQTAVFIPEKLMLQLYEAPKPSDELFKQNPMITMLDYEKQSIQARKRMVTKIGYPMIGLGMQYNLIGKSDMSTSAMNGEDMIMPMATVTLPIYRGKYKAMKKETDLQQTANTQARIATNNSLKTEYYQALEALNNAKLRMELYEKQYKLSEQTLSLVQKGFSTGNSSLNDVLTTNRQSLDYELKKEEAIADYNSAVAWIKRLLCNADMNSAN